MELIRPIFQKVCGRGEEMITWFNQLAYNQQYELIFIGAIFLFALGIYIEHRRKG